MSPPVTTVAANYQSSVFDNWASLISAHTLSPAVLQTGDQQSNWTSPSGVDVQLTVKVPHPAANAPTITLPTVPSGADAMPYFHTALQQVRAQKAGKLVIPTGTYYFNTLDTGGFAHLILNGLTDVTIDGQGSTFVFTQNDFGLYIYGSQRLEITNLKIEYSLHMASLATVVKQGANNVLVVDAAYPVTAADSIGHITEYNRATQSFVQGGQRIYFAPTAVQPVYAGNQTYTSANFNALTPGKSFIIFHHYYGGTAVVVNDFPSPTQSQDIVFNGVTIYSGPGMGFVAYGVKRGFGVWNSQVTLKPGNLISTEYDAMHIAIAGGDVSILNNLISNQGDDAMNLNDPVTPLVSVAADNKTFVLGVFSKFMSAGDVVGFFDASNNFLGTATVATAPVQVSGQNYTVVLDKSYPAYANASIVRDVNLVDSRVVYQGNTIQNCQCHGILIQTPNVLVANNTFTNLFENAIRILTNVGAFVEGMGAVNVEVSNNTITNSGIDAGLNYSWAAISAYGAMANGMSTVPVNKYVDISHNTIINAQQGCIEVESTDLVSIANNTCTSTNLSAAGAPGIGVLYSNGVTLGPNTLTGATTGPVSVGNGVIDISNLSQ